MLIFIENTPRTYAWGSRDALAHMLGKAETGEPQAELWLGAHPGSPATVAKATAQPRTLIDLIESDPERYGVGGGALPFLLKVLAIGAPLSLQVHPDEDQAARGFAAEESAGIPIDAPERTYRDPHHKPELLVALSDVTALCGFRPLDEVRDDVQLLEAAAPEGPTRAALRALGRRLRGSDDAAVRREFLDWALAGCGGEHGADVVDAIRAVTEVAHALQDESEEPRLWVLRSLATAYPEDPGILVSLLLHFVRLAPGESIFLGARQLHAYLGGIAVEVMASSDNVLRAGLTPKHIDADELCRIVDTATLDDPRFTATRPSPGLHVWQPDVPDFRLMRVRVHEPEQDLLPPESSEQSVTIDAKYPLVLIATEGRVRVERPEAELDEVAIVRRGQSLYVSAGDPIALTGRGEVYLATVGESFSR